MKKQVVVIHGGDTFGTYDEYLAFLKGFVIDSLDYFRGRSWKDTLQESLGGDYDVVSPKMPNKFNAKYDEWKIWFHKLTPLLYEEVILIGHSLGGVFLAKYLSEETFPKKILGTFLVAVPFDDKDSDYTLADFNLPEDLSKFQEQAGKIYIYHSKNDAVVPFVDLDKYEKSLPGASIRTFEDRGHFNQEEFPELIEDIKSLR